MLPHDSYRVAFRLSKNGDYKFENNDIASNDRLYYIQNSGFDTSSNLVSDFLIMREMNDKSTDSRLIITHTDSLTTRELLNEDLVELLIPASITKDLDIDDTFDVVVEFISGQIYISVNGWLVKTLNVEL